MFDANLVLLTPHFDPKFNPIQFLVMSLKAGTTCIYFIINFGYFNWLHFLAIFLFILFCLQPKFSN